MLARTMPGWQGVLLPDSALLLRMPMQRAPAMSIVSNKTYLFAGIILSPGAQSIAAWVAMKICKMHWRGL